MPPCGARPGRFSAGGGSSRSPRGPGRSPQRLGARLAINTPIQGSAADMIKAAMIRIWGKLASMRSRMLLQIHDELIFEAAVEELQELKELVKTEMEGVVELKV